jgi:lipoprotein-anchoring transpeptidase ErfK/SrfK
MNKSKLVAVAASLLINAIGVRAFAEEVARASVPMEAAKTGNVLDDFDPWAADAEERLEQLDEAYGDPEPAPQVEELPAPSRKCSGSSCDLWVVVDKTNQIMTVYVYGQVHTLDDGSPAIWAVSTGRRDEWTPEWQGHPNGDRIYTAYMSKKHPSAGYKGLGNMPYAVFLFDGIAVHGTTKIRKLGRRDSKGCIRLHPGNAKIFNDLVRAFGAHRTWVWIHR